MVGFTKAPAAAGSLRRGRTCRCRACRAGPAGSWRPGAGRAGTGGGLPAALVLAACLREATSVAEALAGFVARRSRRTSWVRAQTHRRDRTRDLPPVLPAHRPVEPPATAGQPLTTGSVIIGWWAPP
jgi:hypothetical protein